MTLHLSGFPLPEVLRQKRGLLLRRSSWSGGPCNLLAWTVDVKFTAVISGEGSSLWRSSSKDGDLKFVLSLEVISLILLWDHGHNSLTLWLWCPPLVELFKGHLVLPIVYSACYSIRAPSPGHPSPDCLELSHSVVIDNHQLSPCCYPWEAGSTANSKCIEKADCYKLKSCM